jgi:hypothetical protein
MEVSGQLHASAALPQYTSERMLGGPRSRSGAGEEKSCPCWDSSPALYRLSYPGFQSSESNFYSNIKYFFKIRSSVTIRNGKAISMWWYNPYAVIEPRTVSCGTHTLFVQNHKRGESNERGPSSGRPPRPPVSRLHLPSAVFLVSTITWIWGPHGVSMTTSFLAFVSWLPYCRPWRWGGVYFRNVRELVPDYAVVNLRIAGLTFWEMYPQHNNSVAFAPPKTTTRTWGQSAATSVGSRGTIQ